MLIPVARSSHSFWSKVFHQAKCCLTFFWPLRGLPIRASRCVDTADCSCSGWFSDYRSLLLSVLQTVGPPGYRDTKRIGASITQIKRILLPLCWTSKTTRIASTARATPRCCTSPAPPTSHASTHGARWTRTRTSVKLTRKHTSSSLHWVRYRALHPCVFQLALCCC